MMNELLAKTLAQLKSVGIKPNTRRGQHFVVNREVLETLVDGSKISTHDVILEIGGGLGTLSEYILARNPRRMMVIERDSRLARFLTHKFSNESNVQIICGDYLNIQPIRYDKCISNPPFNISSKIFFKLARERPVLAALTYQEEFADRLLAEAGTRDYGRLSVIARLQFHVEKLRTFDNLSFYPPPKTAISAIMIRPADRKHEDLIMKRLEGLTRELFKYRRKKLGKALRFAGLEPVLASSALAQRLKERRVFEIEPEELIELSKQLALEEE